MYFLLVFVAIRCGRGDAEPAWRVDVEDDGLDVELVAPAVVVVLAVSVVRFLRGDVLSRRDIAVRTKKILSLYLAIAMLCQNSTIS